MGSVGSNEDVPEVVHEVLHASWWGLLGTSLKTIYLTNCKQLKSFANNHAMKILWKFIDMLSLKDDILLIWSSAISIFSNTFTSLRHWMGYRHWTCERCWKSWGMSVRKGLRLGAFPSYGCWLGFCITTQWRMNFLHHPFTYRIRS